MTAEIAALEYQTCYPTSKTQFLDAFVITRLELIKTVTE